MLNADYQGTLNYYNTNAADYVNQTKNCDMDAIRRRFEHYIPHTGIIADIGCGSGRDSKAFMNDGYKVVAMDGSKELSALAEKNTGIPVECCTFLEYTPKTKLDGVWANASLLHLHESDIVTVLNHFTKYVREGGYLYMSLKKGNFEGIRDGRYYCDMNNSKLGNIVGQTQWKIAETFETGDTIGRGNAWCNIILRNIASGAV